MRRRRRLWIILLATPLLLAAADTLYWRLVERDLEDGFAAWLAARRASGWTVTVGQAARGGWPLAATLTVPMVFLKGGDPDITGGLTWKADRLVLGIALMRPKVLEIVPEGIQHLRFADGPEVSAALCRDHCA